MARLVLSVFLVALSACVVGRGLRAGDGIQGEHSVSGPGFDRCKKQPKEFRSDCEAMRHEAMRFVRRLSVDDQVCLEGNAMSNGVTGRCVVRAFVEDASASAIKLEIRDAPRNSKYTPMDDYWFDEEALVDIYLSATYAIH